MIRSKIELLLVFVLGLAVILTGCGGSSSVKTQQPPAQIAHVVIIFQENRSVDNLFQDSVLISRGADIASQGKTSTGQTIPLTPVSLVVPYDLGHSHLAFLAACDYAASTNTCAMDGADQVPCTGQGCPADASYQYVEQSDVQPYFQMAETYTFSDRMFQTNEGPSFPAHQYIISGTSRIEATSSTTVADNPSDNLRDGSAWAGCLAPPSSFVNAIDISQPSPETALTIVDYPLCFEHPTLTDLLDQANLTWKYYAPTSGSIWTAPDAIQHMCQPFSQDGKYDDTVCDGPDWTSSNPKVVIEGSGAQIITDIMNCDLANVSWVIPTGNNSDHAGNPQDNGPSWVASIVNQIGQNPVCAGGTADAGQTLWNNTVIIVTWDDWGGWYDHVPPPVIRDSYEYGLRVPLIAISPYAKPAYISHQVNDFGSILKFIEETFSLTNTIDYSNPSVPYADSYALGDLSDCFNFSQTPLKFTPISSDLKADHFLNDKSPPTPPDNN